MKIKICGDVYNISKRIKKIDKDYYVVYNTSKQKFEIHNSNQIGSSYCLTLPFCELDERALKFVRKTQSANIAEILESIDKQNKLKESADIDRTLSKVYDHIFN